MTKDFTKSSDYYVAYVIFVLFLDSQLPHSFTMSVSLENCFIRNKG